jgi:hypothetical protein
MIEKKYFKTKDSCKVKFSVQLKNVQHLEVLGLEGNWEEGIFMKKKKDGTFSCEVSLPKNSEHQFRYRLDGTEWIDDPQADALVHNEFGGTNSFIQI